MVDEKKKHISFSAMSVWTTCPYKYKLVYIDQVGSSYSPYLDYGSAVHDAIDTWFREEVNLLDEFEVRFRRYVEENSDKYKESQKGVIDIELWLIQGKNTLTKIEKFLKKEYKDYAIHDTEEDLYEDIDGEELKFKGFIDVVLKHKTENKYVLLDWKTTTWGWNREARGDKVKKMQPLLYKHFWCKKHGVDPDNVSVAFALLKRTAKRNICERIGIRSSEKYVDRAITNLKRFMYGIKIGKFIKNKNSCVNCDFGRWAKDDSLCDGARKFMKTEPKKKIITEDLHNKPKEISVQNNVSNNGINRESMLDKIRRMA